MRKKRLIVYVIIKSIIALGAGILIFVALQYKLSKPAMVLAFILYAMLGGIAVNAAYKWYDDA